MAAASQHCTQCSSDAFRRMWEAYWCGSLSWNAQALIEAHLAECVPLQEEWLLRHELELTPAGIWELDDEPAPSSTTDLPAQPSPEREALPVRLFNAVRKCLAG